MKYPVRLATKDECEKIGTLYEKAFDCTEGVLKYYTWFGEYLAFFIDQNNAFVIEDGDALCAAALVYETPDMISGRSLYIDFLAVLPDYQNMGMCGTLIEYVCDEAWRRRISEVSIRTACYKDAYLKYRHMGFKDSQGNCQYLIMNLKN